MTLEVVGSNSGLSTRRRHPAVQSFTSERQEDHPKSRYHHGSPHSRSQPRRHDVTTRQRAVCNVLFFVFVVAVVVLAAIRQVQQDLLTPMDDLKFTRQRPRPPQRHRRSKKLLGRKPPLVFVGHWPFAPASNLPRGRFEHQLHVVDDEGDPFVIARNGQRRPNPDDSGGLLQMEYQQFVQEVDMTPPSPRRLRPRDHIVYEWYRRQLLTRIDRNMYQKNARPRYDHTDELDEPRECRRVPWRMDRYLTCNHVHELTVDRVLETIEQDHNITYIRHGSFREAWIFERPMVDESFVLKALRINKDGGNHHLNLAHMEALIMERVSSSPRIVDIYGFCGNSLLVETMPHEMAPDLLPGDGKANQADLDKEPELRPRNNYTAAEKLDMALLMAEALADLHGFKGGVMLQGDTHPNQYLKSLTGQVKLNDFNTGWILDWNTSNNDYCTVRRSFSGIHHAPEEMLGEQCNEGLDIFSLGNSFYILLTGLWPFYNEPDEDVIYELILNGTRPFVDPRFHTRSFIESKLIEIMEQCWEMDPSQRVDIFTIVKFLRDVKATHYASQKGEIADTGVQLQ